MIFVAVYSKAMIKAKFWRKPLRFPSFQSRRRRVMFTVLLPEEIEIERRAGDSGRWHPGDSIANKPLPPIREPLV